MPPLPWLLGQATSPAFSVYVGATPVKYGAAQPLRSGKRMLVPLRATVEALGGTVQGPIRHRLYINLGRRRVELSLNGGKSRIDGILRTLKAAPWISRGEAVVPPSFFTEALRLAIVIDPKGGSVQIVPGGGFR